MYGRQKKRKTAIKRFVLKFEVGGLNTKKRKQLQNGQKLEFFVTNENFYILVTHSSWLSSVLLLE